MRQPNPLEHTVKDPSPNAKLTIATVGRNRGPILEVLRSVLPASGDVLEVASGTGEHAVFFAEQLPALSWQPTEVEPSRLASIAAWADEAQLLNLHPPQRLDVTVEDWPVSAVDAIVNINMVHAAPWSTCQGLMRGAGRVLSDAGVVVMYGPFRFGFAHTAPSNAAFDQWLKARDPGWGVRDFEAIDAEAEAAGLRFQGRFEMPAENFCLVFGRAAI